MPLFENLYFLVMLWVWPGMLKAKLLHHATDSSRAHVNRESTPMDGCWMAPLKRNQIGDTLSL